jgi:hypothetical protein
MATLHTSILPEKILFMKFDGNLGDDKEVEQFVSQVGQAAVEIKDFYTKSGKPIKILVDMTTFEAGPNSKTFESLVDLAKGDKGLVDKTAMYGGSTTLQAFIKALMYLSGRTNMKLLKSREEALEWLAQ